MNTIDTTSPIELTRTKRMLRFLYAAIPGALIVGLSGSLMVVAGTNGKDVWFCSFLGFAFLFGCGLLLHGTSTAKEPLVLLMFTPIALLIPYGYEVDYWDGKTWTSPPFIGFIAPIILYPLISHHYKKRARKPAIPTTPPTPTDPTINNPS